MGRRERADSAGRRIEKKYDGTTVVKYLYDGDHCLAEYDGNNNLLRKYIYGPAVDEPISMIDVEHESATYYYHFDGLGSVIALTNASGTTAVLYEYSVYGQVAASDPNHPNRFLFTGREFDQETGLYYYRARYYNPEIGRFLQTDPTKYGDGVYWYTYCANNPVGATDPSGLFWYIWGKNVIQAQKDAILASMEAVAARCDFLLYEIEHIYKMLEACSQDPNHIHYNIQLLTELASLSTTLEKIRTGIRSKWEKMQIDVKPLPSTLDGKIAMGRYDPGARYGRLTYNQFVFDYPFDTDTTTMHELGHRYFGSGDAGWGWTNNAYHFERLYYIMIESDPWYGYLVALMHVDPSVPPGPPKEPPDPPSMS